MSIVPFIISKSLINLFFLKNIIYRDVILKHKPSSSNYMYAFRSVPIHQHIDYYLISKGLTNAHSQSARLLQLSASVVSNDFSLINLEVFFLQLSFPLLKVIMLASDNLIA